MSDIARSTAVYTAALAPLGIVHSHDYDGRDGPSGHPELIGFGENGRVYFWLRKGVVQGQAAPYSTRTATAWSSSTKAGSMGLDMRSQQADCRHQ